MQQITWGQFLVCSGGEYEAARKRFEDLSRQLFYEHLKEHNMDVSYINSKPNHPGLESYPVYDEKNNIHVGFQSKFFNYKVDYAQIKKSFELIVKHCNKLDKVYLYCNLTIDSDANSFKEAKNILTSKNIELELVTNDTILDLVRRYDNLALYYFSNHNINDEWIKEYNENILYRLGARYNNKFNIETNTSKYLSLFLRDDKAINYLNNKKKIIIEDLDKLKYRLYEYNRFKNNLRQAIENIDDVEYKNINDALEWDNKIQNNLKKDIDYLKKELENINKSFKEKNYETIEKEKNIKKLLQISKKLKLDELEKKSIDGKILIIKGKAGTGKTHLLANEIKYLMDSNRIGLIITGNTYLSDDPIKKQIDDNIGKGLSVEQILTILNNKAFIDDKIIPIFIDALNETTNKDLWKIYVPELLNLIRKYENLKLVLTYREEYEEILIEEYNLCEDDVCKLEHKGFVEDPLNATKIFLRNYGIPFTPINMFNMNTTNPLFLTLYCKTYISGEADIQTLYERMLKISDKNFYKNYRQVCKNNGYSEVSKITELVVLDIIKLTLKSGKKIFTIDELSNLNIWEKLKINYLIFLEHLSKENILNSYVLDDTEIYEFAYDQMNDYYLAKAMLKEYPSRELIDNYIKNTILCYGEENRFKYENLDLFINICALYAEKFNDECIKLIDCVDEYDREYIFQEYVKSFGWRKNIRISIDEFYRLCSKYNLSYDILWDCFIMNSLKENNTFNANTLDELLYNCALNKRDYVWTIYINNIERENENRLLDLIKLYSNCEKLDIKSDEQLKLLLILFGWLLSSTSRFIRDTSSKAMIEILKEHFDLCQFILEKFNEVNDPYIIQRLYGIVWGACSKRVEKNKEIYNNLADYVYNTVFNTDYIYPDILLRDYARLIIERFIYEFGNENNYFDLELIKPPYKSEDIPKIEDKKYNEKIFDYSSGLYSIISSMIFDTEKFGCGAYGDFGRYVFQSALNYFPNIDLYEIFNYSIDYIINSLGYDNDLFGEYDKMVLNYEYNPYIKSTTERIGKKYQWITMYNVLARTSDKYRKKEPYSDKELEVYSGPWSPYVRDFDPTLNENNMDLNKYIRPKGCLYNNEEIKHILKTEEDENCWLNEYPKFFDYQKLNMVITDEEDKEWVVLLKYSDANKGEVYKQLQIWNWVYGYFVKDEQYQKLKEYVDDNKDLLNSDVTYIPSRYELFSREYPWFESSDDLANSSWKTIELKTGKKIKEKILLPKLLIKSLEIDELEEILFSEEKGNEIEDKIDIEEIDEIEEKLYIREIDETEILGEILCTGVKIIWEEEYDKSKKDTIPYYALCKDFIQDMSLCYGELDGVFYDSKGEIASFDISYISPDIGLAVRKDILDEFLEKNNYYLVYFVRGSKEIHNEKGYISKYSDWTGLLKYNDDIVGNIYRVIENK